MTVQVQELWMRYSAREAQDMPRKIYRPFFQRFLPERFLS
jgi:hypothetical protein